MRWTVSGLLSFTCSNTRWYCTLKTRSLVSGFPEIAVISSTTRRDACGAGGFKAELLSDPNELQETAPLCWSSARRPIIRRHMSESIAARRSGSFRWRVCVKSPPSVFTLGLLYNEGAWTGEVFIRQLLPKQYGCTNEGNHDERRHSLTVTREKS